MNKILLNTIRLASVSLNTLGATIKKIIRYVPDNKVPDTHVKFNDADGVQLAGADDNVFYVKTE